MWQVHETINFNMETINLLLPSAFTIAMLGAIESLLSATVADGVTAFKLDQFKEDLEGMNGIILRMNTRQNGVIYLQINMSKEK